MPLTPESAARKDKTNARGATFEHRHFAALAMMIREMPTVDRPRRSTADYFADRLAETNPRFDRARFLAACGV